MRTKTARGAVCALNAFFGSLLTLLLAIPAVQAAMFTVTCLLHSGSESLREAIGLANTNNGDDLIVFNVSGTISLTSTLPAVTDTLKIDGAGRSITLSEGDAVRILAHTEGALEINALTFSNGRAISDRGGAIYTSGGVSLKVTNATFSNNRADSGQGGAIAMLSGELLSIADSRFPGNAAGPGGGAIWGTATTKITPRSTFENNSGASGGALWLQGGGSSTISDSTFDGNSAVNGSGGAILTSVGGWITNSTFNANSAVGVGGCRSCRTARRLIAA